MTTAVLISGQARTFAQCLPTQHWHVYRRFTDLHFFIVWQKSPEAEAGVKLLAEKYGVDRVHAELIADPTDLPMIPLAKGEFAPYANAAPHPQLMMQHWYQEQVWLLYQKHAANCTADVFIRMRGDNFFHSMAETKLWNLGRMDALLPWWGRFGGVNDRLAILGADAAHAYFTVYSQISTLLELGCPFHPESLLKGALELGGVHQFDNLRAEFSTWRANGKHRYWSTEIMHNDLRTF